MKYFEGVTIEILNNFVFFDHGAQFGFETKSIAIIERKKYLKFTWSQSYQSLPQSRQKK